MAQENVERYNMLYDKLRAALPDDCSLMDVIRSSEFLMASVLCEVEDDDLDNMMRIIHDDIVAFRQIFKEQDGIEPPSFEQSQGENV